METTHLISIAQVGATAFVGIVAGFITWRMQSKQIDIAKGVKEIALSQHETAATKLRLELFEKRFETYKKVLSHIDAALKHDYYENQVDIKKLVEDYKQSCAPVKFLFNQYIHKYLTDDVVELIKDHGEAVYAMGFPGKRDVDLDIVREQYTSSYAKLLKVIRILDGFVSPFLLVEKEKPVIDMEKEC